MVAPFSAGIRFGSNGLLGIDTLIGPASLGLGVNGEARARESATS